MSINTQQVQALPFTELIDDIMLILSRLESIRESDQRDLSYYTNKGNTSEAVISKYKNRITTTQHAFEFVNELVNRLQFYQIFLYIATIENAGQELAKTGKKNMSIMLDFKDGQMVASTINPY